MTKDFRDRRLIINERIEEYDGTTAVVRTEHLAADEVEFLRWRAERWMKLRPVTSGPWHASGPLLRTQKVRALALSGRAYYERKRTRFSKAALRVGRLDDRGRVWEADQPGVSVQWPLHGQKTF